MPSGPRSVKSPRNHRRAVPADQFAGGVDEALLLERGDQLVEIAVHVADDVQRARPGGGPGGRHDLGIDHDLKRVTPVDDRQIAPGGRVALGLLVGPGHLAWRCARRVRTGLVDVRGHPEVAQRLRPHRLGSLTGP